MTPPPAICIACAQAIPPGAAVIVGLDVSDFPARVPTNVLACKACESRARQIIAKALAGSGGKRR